MKFYILPTGLRVSGYLIETDPLCPSTLQCPLTLKGESPKVKGHETCKVTQDVNLNLVDINASRLSIMLATLNQQID